MKNARYAVASYDEFYDIIGVVETDTENYQSVMEKFPVHSTFIDKKDALREAKRLSKQNGAFFVETEMDKQYLVFRSEDDNGEQSEYLTTRRAIAKVLEANQENGIAWETVDAVLEDYQRDKEVGRIIETWLDGNGILQRRDAQSIKKLKFYTQKTREQADEFCRTNKKTKEQEPTGVVEDLLADATTRSEENAQTAHKMDYVKE